MPAFLRVVLHHRLSRLGAIALLSLIFSLPAVNAQSTFGTILGTVKDNSGAVVPNAKIKVTDTDENTSREVTANGNGDYEFVNTKPSHYKLEVTAAGFNPLPPRNCRWLRARLYASTSAFRSARFLLRCWSKPPRA